MSSIRSIYFLPLALSLTFMFPYLRVESKSIPAKREADKACYLVQWSLPSGHCNTYIDAHGMRIDFGRNGNILIAKAPDWKVVMFNKKSRRIFVNESADWDGGELQKYLDFTASNLRDLDWSRSGVGKAAGIVGTRYVMTGPKASLNLATKKRLRNRYGAGEMIVTEKCKVPRAVSLIMDRTFGCPELPGLPLSLMLRARDHADGVFLRIDKLVEMKLDPARLQIPTGYKVVKHSREIDGESINEFIDDLAR